MKPLRILRVFVRMENSMKYFVIKRTLLCGSKFHITIKKKRQKTDHLFKDFAKKCYVSDEILHENTNDDDNDDDDCDDEYDDDDVNGNALR